MILIAGLGNPETKYEKTRHNLGFMVIDQICKEFGVELKEEKKFNAKMVRVHEGPDEAFLVKPLTYMNNSGEAVKKIADYYNIVESDVWIIHDDIDIDLGRVRIRKGGSSAGQKGVESIIKHLGTEEFIRFRMGIKPSEPVNVPSEDFVLSKFTNDEKEPIKNLIEGVTETIAEAVRGKDLEHTTK